MDPEALASTATFQLGTVGAVVTERFTRAVAAHDLKPKHAGVLQALLLFPGISQQELAQSMGVAPSLMVGLLDHLEAADAVRRERDPGDRRRQVIEVTAEGRRLFALCAESAAAIESELLDGLGERAGEFRLALAEIAGNLGLPSGKPR
ncbi:MarR family transcriptional regulator [Phytomonospora sp. NPDC050363]|uniref:MarR family winged helix-turn-helix transcriptional regulator n=1 Tax=Phytomonospora sp. NPDC050363 TaxID=3155642 RepID=UPI00340A0CD1